MVARIIGGNFDSVTQQPHILPTKKVFNKSDYFLNSRKRVRLILNNCVNCVVNKITFRQWDILSDPIADY